jgi:hypothetical protein
MTWRLQDDVLSSLDISCFHELALICLLPEVLPQFHEFIGENFVANLFTQPRNICILLKHLVTSAINDLINSPSDKIATLALYTIHHLEWESQEFCICGVGKLGYQQVELLM